MRNLVWSFLFFALLASASVMAQAQLPDATPITTFPFTQVLNTQNATSAINYDCFSGPIYNVVWYKFTPASDMKLEFNTMGSKFDTVIALYGAYYDSYLQFRFCNDDYSGDQSRLLTTVSPLDYGTYYIAVGSSDPAVPGGELHFNAGLVTPPGNDLLENPTRVPSLPFTATQNNFAATWSNTDPATCDPGGGSVWFLYDATYDGFLKIASAGSSYPVITTVYTGTPAALSQLKCGGQTLIVPVANGTRYYVRFDGYYGEMAQGDLVATFDVGPPPFDVTVGQLIGNVVASTGNVTLGGVLHCNAPSWINVSGRISQRFGMTTAMGWFSAAGWCSPATGLPWTSSVNYQTTNHAGRSFALFNGGKADLDMQISANDYDSGQSVTKEIPIRIRLKSGPAPRY